MMLQRYLELPYANLLPHDPWFPIRRYRLIWYDGKWRTFDEGNTLWTARNRYLFVFQRGEIYVARERVAALGHIAGHIDIARGQDVDYAGEVQFGSGDSSRGKLRFWNNHSGHYQPKASEHPVVALLPSSAFKAWQGD